MMLGIESLLQSASYIRTQLFSINFNMFNKLLNNTLVQHGQSNCARHIIANVADGTCMVTYKDGSVYEYTNVSRRALYNLVTNDNISLGRWINDVLLFVDSKCAKYGTCTLRYAA